MLQQLKKIVLACCLVMIFFIGFTLLLGLAPGWHKQHTPVEALEKFSQERISSQTENLVLYLRRKVELNTSYYSDKEILHLQDVQELVQQAKKIVILLLAVIVFTLPHKKSKTTRELLRHSATISIGIIIAVTVVIAAFFEPLFLKAHEVLFSNDAWLLDPSHESLIVIFSPEVFMGLFIQVGILTILANILLTLICTKKSLNKQKSNT